MPNIGEIFVVGYVRSGTTLIAAMLDRHSRVAVPPETHFYDLFWPDDRRPAGTWEEMVDAFLQFRYGDQAYLGLKRDDLLSVAAGVPPRWPSLLRIVLRAYARQCGKVFPAEKTPFHLYHVGRILRDFPEAKIIFVTRDGRDALSSAHEVWPFKNSMEVHAWHWRKAMELMFHFETLFGDRICRVSYESVLANPEPQLRRLCAFCDIDFEPSQLDHRIPTRVAHPHELSWKKNIFQPLSQNRRGRWREMFSLEDQATMTSIVAPCNAALGLAADEGDRPGADGGDPKSS